MIVISLATNDPDNGNDNGVVSMIEVNDAIELEWGELGSEPRYSIGRNFLKLSRRKFPIASVKHWFGNWCWTGVWMRDKDAADFLNYISKDDRWHCTGGWCDFTDAYAASRVTPEMVREAAME